MASSRERSRARKAKRAATRARRVARESRSRTRRVATGTSTGQAKITFTDTRTGRTTTSFEKIRTTTRGGSGRGTARPELRSTSVKIDANVVARRVALRKSREVQAKRDAQIKKAASEKRIKSAFADKRRRELAKGSTLQKEKEKRLRISGQDVTPTGEPRGVFGKTAKERRAVAAASKFIVMQDPRLSQTFKEKKRLTATEQIRAVGALAKQSPTGFRHSSSKRDLLNIPKNVGIGVSEVGKSLLFIPIDAVRASYSFGVKATREANKKQISVARVFGRKFLRLSSDVNQVRKFVQDNPKGAAVLVGAVAAEQGDSFLRSYEENPVKTLTRVVASWMLPDKFLKAFKKGGQTLSKLSSQYRKIEAGKIQLRKAPSEKFKVRGKERLLEKRVQKPSIKRPFESAADFLKKRRPGQFKKFTKDPGIILKTQTVSSGSRTLAQQAQLAGSEVTAVNAAADQITSFIKRKQIIRKPIPGEADAPVKVKNILKKFDKGIKLSTKEFAFVNKWLQKNVQPNITLLERSLYLDPDSGLRLSRLAVGAQRSATLKDILKFNFTFKKNLPQVLIFQNAKVAKFPKSLSDVVKKLKSGKKLTIKETNRLIAWQVKTGDGKFKPIGSTIYSGGKELEVTLAPGTLIKRIKQIGFTFVEGQKVTFVTAQVYAPPISLLAKMKKAARGLLKDKEVVALEKELSKKLGRKIKVETPKSRGRRSTAAKPILRVSGRGINVISGIVRGAVRAVRRAKSRARPAAKARAPARRSARPKARPTPRAPPRSPARSTPRTPPRAPPRSPPRTTRKAPPRAPPRRPGRAPPRAPPTKTPVREVTPLTFRSKLPRGTKLKFDVVYRERRVASKPFNAKSNKVIVKTRKLGLPLNRAIKLGFSAVDATTQASARLIIAGTTKAKDIAKQTILLKKFATAKTRNALRFVEKNKHRIDTKGEKRGLSLSKLLKRKAKKKTAKKRKK